MGERLATDFAATSKRRKRPLDGPTIIRAAVVAVCLLGWEASARVGLVDKFFFSSPLLIVGAIGQQFASGAIYKHLIATLTEALWGLLLALLAGAALGWGAARNRPLAAVVEPALMLLNSVPRIVAGPILIMWLGIGPPSKVALAFFLAFVVIFFAVYSGLREVDQALVERVLVLGGTERDVLLHVYAPSVMVRVFSSLRVTVGLAFTGAIVGEFIASSQGLGYLLSFAQSSYNASLLMGVVCLIMAVVMLLFLVLSRIEARVMRWKALT